MRSELGLGRGVGVGVENLGSGYSGSLYYVEPDSVTEKFFQVCVTREVGVGVGIGVGVGVGVRVPGVLLTASSRTVTGTSLPGI